MQRTTDKAWDKYLRNYAEPEVQLLEDWPDKCFSKVLVIPSYRESPQFLQRFFSEFCNQGVLLILVVNQPANDNTEANAELLSFIQTNYPLHWQSAHLKRFDFTGSAENASALLLVERHRENLRIPRKQGVGLARKIGTDLACSLIARGAVNSPWIHSTDADAQLPPDYFDNLPNPNTHSAALYPFTHSGPSDAVLAAVTLYEQALQLYVDGLRSTGSPWAFHTVGSTLALSAKYYAQARGFPRRAAGEDFYLLNKLHKLAPVLELTERQPIRLRARLSNRVPFGTGPATEKILRQLASGDEPLWYAPEIYTELKLFLTQAIKNPETVLENKRWKGALEELGWQEFLDHCAKQRLQACRKESALHEWFDGFRTLRFLHLLQKKFIPQKPLREMIAVQIART